MRIEINVLKTIDNLYIYTTYYSNYNRKTSTICQANCFKSSQLILDISNEELTNKFD